MSKKPIIRPDFQELIPPLAPNEYGQLEANIKAEGCRDPIVLWGNVIIDGHNRYEICTRHGIEFKTVEMDFADRSAARVWIIRNQFGRRNITLATRCEMAERLAKELKPLAEAARINGNAKGGRGKSSPKLGSTSKINAIKDAAKEAGVAHGSLAAFRYLKENADPEELETLKKDPNAKLHRVVKDVRERKAKAEREGKRTEAAKQTKIPDNLIVGDFRDHADKVADGSVSLIFTDPPYDRKASNMLGDLGSFADAKLMDGGSLILYVGQTQIPAALDALRPHLRYWWTIACVHAGRSTVMREYGINAGWKAVLWFVKGTRHDNSVMVSDVMSGGEEKTHHDWQQSESEAAYWINKLCQEDGIVCDPFTGGGTTGAAAKSLGRKFIGFEINDTFARIAAERL